jgi:Glycoside hydrolase family 44
MPIQLSHSAWVSVLAIAGSVVACGSSSSSGSSSAAGAAGGNSAGAGALSGSNGSAGSTNNGSSGMGGASTGGSTTAGSSAGGASSAGSSSGGMGGTPPNPTQPCGAALPAPTPSGSATGPVLQVDVCASRHFISPDIYGVTFWFAGDTSAGNMQFAKDIALPLNRLGGDATTRYNWQVDSSNAGFDFYFMGGSGTTPTPGASKDALVTTNQTFGAKTVMTIPIIEYINKSADTHCSYPKSVYPNQQSYNPYVPPNNDGCGNGKDSGGNVITDTHITDHDVANDPSIQQAWVTHLVGKFGTAAKGGVPIYQMDNEPTGWPGIHFDVRPVSPTCEELRDRTYAYAVAVKTADATASVLGPGDIPVADDFDCGGVTRGQYYLAAMADYEKQHGVRILDYYSHHYPGCCSGDPIANLEARIKKHQGWIADKYPGTKLGYDEYNWGADVDTYATALLSADGLGVFGRDSVDMASFWGLDDATKATATAFRLYRNYDGKGGAFGDVSTSASSADATKLHVYAAQRTGDNAVTVVVVNKTAADITSALSLSNHTAKASAHVFVFSSAEPKSVVAQPDLTIADAGNIVVTYPAASATLLVVP